MEFANSLFPLVRKRHDLKPASCFSRIFSLRLRASALKSFPAARASRPTLYSRWPVFHYTQGRFSSAFHAHIQTGDGIALPVAIEQPRQSDLGNMAVPAAF